MNKILACTDGSPYAPSIYDHAAWVAKRMDAAVHILHMLDAHRERAESVDLSGNIGLDTGDALLQQLVSLEETKNRLAREQGKVLLAEAVRALTAAGVRDVTSEQQHGELVETVVAMEANADLVVLGKRGESSDFAKNHLGSNVERVIRGSIRPILVTSRQFFPIKKFLIAYDGGSSMGKAVDFLLNQPLLKGLECHILHAGKMEHQIAISFNECISQLRAGGFHVIPHTPEAHPEAAMTQAIEKEELNLLVMGAYGHSRLRHLMVGSVTTAMIRTSTVPVLMFR